MNTDYTDHFTSIKIIHDETDGLINLDTIRRIDQDRQTKVRNNFTGQLQRTKSETLLEIINILNKKLPPKTENELIVGLATSGIIMSSHLSMVRQSSFTYSASKKYDVGEKVFSFTEGHRQGKLHYMYSIKPGDSVIVIEDEVTSGNGIVTFVQSLKDFGVEVRAIASLIEVMNFGAREKILNETGMNLVSLVQIELE